MVQRGQRARLIDVEDSIAEVNETFYERGWTDGLPVLPPTEAAVAAMLRGTDRDPDEVIAALAPSQSEATVEKIAINAVMAGCRPEYLPVVIAAVEAVGQPEFNLSGVQATTHPVAPLIVVNGPLARQLSINSGYNCLGQGFRANATIGRALRLLLMNVGGGTPGAGDRSTQGSPAKYTYCVAENEAANPWGPLHVEKGHPPEVSTVTVTGCEGPHNIQDHHSDSGLGILLTVAGAMGQAGSNNILALGYPILDLGPEHAATLAADGYTKDSIREYVFEHARYPLDKLDPKYTPVLKEVGSADPDGRVKIMWKPSHLQIIVSGGAGKHSCWHPTFGSATKPVTRVISDRNGEPLLAR